MLELNMLMVKLQYFYFCRSSKELTRPVSPHFTQKSARDEFSRDDFGQSITGSIQRRINMR
jgi:hypothetical protein